MSGYAKLVEAVVVSNLVSREKIVLMTLLTMERRYGTSATCFATLDKIARLSRVSKSTARSALKGLEARGLIRTAHTPNSTARTINNFAVLRLNPLKG